MTELTQSPRRSSSMVWIGLLIVLLGVASNFLYWLPLPQVIIPWITLALALIGLIVVIAGLLRMWPGSQAWLKVVGVCVGVLSAAVFALSLWGHISAREVPRSAGAPQVGQKVPDFTLPDSSGQPVSLSQLLSSPVGSAPKPKAVLLVFYRGYW